MLLLRKILAFLRRDLLLQFSYRFAMVVNLVVVVFGVAAYYFLSRLFNIADFPEFRMYGSGYFSFILIGIACYSYMNVALGTFSSSLRQAQTSGTLEAMMLTRTSLTSIMIFSSLWAFIYTIVQLVLYILVGWGLFGFDLSRIDLSSSILMLLLIAVSFSPLAILSASFILAFKRGDPIFFVISGLSALLGGVYYPVTVLPHWLQHLSAVLPITTAVDLLRKAIALGYSERQLLPDAGKLLLLTLVLFPVAVFSFGLAIRRVKENGTLSQF